jgi:tankyrase
MGAMLLHSAAKSGNMQLLTRSVAMPGVKLEVTDRSGSTPLHYAVRYGQKEAVAFLIQAGASLDARDAWGSMPLHVAASEGQSEALKLLLDAGSDIRAVDNAGNSALHLTAARSWGSDNVGQLLLDAGAEINLKNIYGDTPLACADDLGSRSFTDLLRKCGGTR